MLRILDTLIFSSLWAALAGAGMLTVSAVSMQVALPGSAVLLVFFGTLVVYNIDRIRDLPRDREISPLRSAFVERHRRGLMVLTGFSALACLALAYPLGVRAVLVLLPALALGLVHRRIKGIPVLKGLYITGAWLVVMVGLPVALAPEAQNSLRVAGILGCAILANVIASSVRDHEAGARAFGPGLSLALGEFAALVGVGLGVFATRTVVPMLLLPAASGLAILFYRPGERYGMAVVDGALLLSSVLALVWVSL